MSSTDEQHKKISSSFSGKFGLSRLSRSPAWLLCIIAASAFVSEAVDMILLTNLPPLATPTIIFLDAVILVVLLIPILIMFVFRPLVIQITERNEAEKALALEKDRLKKILDSMKDPVVIINNDHVIEYGNAALLRLFGPVNDRRCHEYFHNLGEPCPGCRNQEVFSGKSINWQFTSTVTGQSFDLFDAPYPKPDGSFAKIEIFHDITSLKEAEEELRKRELEFRTLAENSPDVIIRLDSQLRYLYVNPAVAQRTGLPTEALTGRSFREMGFPTNIVELWDHNCTLALTSNRIVEMEYVLPTPQGERMLEARIVPERDLDGNVCSLLVLSRDISDRRRAEEDLRASERLLRQVLEIIPVGVWIIDAEGTVVRANAACRDIWGDIRLVGMNGYSQYTARWSQDGRPVETHEWAVVRALSNRETTLGQIVDIDTFDGRQKTILNSAAPLVTENGILAGAVVVNTDITELRRAREEIVTEHNRLISILNTLDDAIFIVSRDFSFDYANAKVARLFGPTENKTCQEYFAGIEELCPWKRQLALKPFEPFRTTISVERIGRLFEVTILPIKGMDGSIAMLEVLHDITERRKSSKEVRKIYQAVEQNSTAVVIVDRHGRIEYVNPRFSALTGYCREEVYGRNPNILKGDNTTVDEYRLLWETITSGREWRGEFFNKKKSGEFYWELNTISPIFDTEGVITNFVAVKEDITERKRVEHALHDSREELRQLSAHLQQVREGERTSIAREIHDELGQSLATLQLSVCLLAAELEPGQAELREQAREMSQLIAATVKGLQRLCAELRPVMIDELGLLAALEWQARQFEKKSGICCEFVFDLQTVDLPSSVATALFRIYQEAMTNVIRHAEADLVDASLVEKGNWLTLRVRDNGKGIPPRTGSSKKSYGLIGMRERAASLGGKVRICSNQQKGTAVLARLPILTMAVEE